MAFLGRLTDGLNGTAVFHLFTMIFRTVHQINQRIFVHGKRSADGHVVSRHRFRHILPSREGMTHFHRRSDRLNRGSVNHGINMMGQSVHLIGQHVGVHRKFTVDIYIVGRHRFRYILPAAKGMTFFLGSCDGHNRCPVVQAVAAVCFAIDKVAQPIAQNCKGSRQFHIMIRHHIHHVLPSAKEVSLLFGRRHFGQDRIERCSHHATQSGSHHAIHHERQVEGVGITTHDHQVVGRHRFGSVLPSLKEAAGFFRWFGQDDGSAIVHAVATIDGAIDHISNLIGIDLEHGLHCHIASRHAVGLRFRPLQEGMALFRWFGSVGHGLSVTHTSLIEDGIAYHIGIVVIVQRVGTHHREVTVGHLSG